MLNEPMVKGSVIGHLDMWNGTWLKGGKKISKLMAETLVAHSFSIVTMSFTWTIEFVIFNFHKIQRQKNVNDFATVKTATINRAVPRTSFSSWKCSTASLLRIRKMKQNGYYFEWSRFGFKVKWKRNDGAAGGEKRHSIFMKQVI